MGQKDGLLVPIKPHSLSAGESPEDTCHSKEDMSIDGTEKVWYLSRKNLTIAKST